MLPSISPKNMQYNKTHSYSLYLPKESLILIDPHTLDILPRPLGNENARCSHCMADIFIIYCYKCRKFFKIASSFP